MKYGPFICIAVVFAVMFVLWAFWGGKDYEFVGLAPLSPDTCGSYTGSVYNWGNITPAVGYDPIEGHNCVPPDGACLKESVDTTPQPIHPPIVVDNTPDIPVFWKSTDSNPMLGQTFMSNMDPRTFDILYDKSSVNSPIMNDNILIEDLPICIQEPDISLEINLENNLGNYPANTLGNTLEKPSENNLENTLTNNIGNILHEVPVPRIDNLPTADTLGVLNNNSQPIMHNLPLILDNNSQPIMNNLPLILDYNPMLANRSQPVRNNYPQANRVGQTGRGRFMSRGERLCCQTMERIYGVPFTSQWPHWLRNPETGKLLELDCYNADLKIAVEYNGEQHYKWPNFTNQSYQQFINQVRRDKLKFDICDKNGVYLITVPYIVSYDRILSYIMSLLPETIQKNLQEDKIAPHIPWNN